MIKKINRIKPRAYIYSMCIKRRRRLPVSRGILYDPTDRINMRFCPFVEVPATTGYRSTGIFVAYVH